MSEVIKTWSQWLLNSRFSYLNEEQRQQTLNWLLKVRDKVLDRASLKEDDCLIDVGTGIGLLAFRASEILKEKGHVIASDAFIDCLDECRKVAKECEIEDRMEFLQTDATDIKLPENSVDVVVMRSVLVHILDKQKAINEFFRILKPQGRISIFEPVINTNTKYYQLVDEASFPNYERIKEAEIKIMSDANDPLTNFNEKTLIENFEKAGFKNIDLDLTTETSCYVANESMIDPWLNTPAGSGNKTMKQRFLEYLPEDEVEELIKNLKIHLHNKEITLKSFSAYISAVK